MPGGVGVVEVGLGRMPRQPDAGVGLGGHEAFRVRADRVSWVAAMYRGGIVIQVGVPEVSVTASRLSVHGWQARLYMHALRDISRSLQQVPR